MESRNHMASMSPVMTNESFAVRLGATSTVVSRVFGRVFRSRQRRSGDEVALKRESHASTAVETNLRWEHGGRRSTHAEADADEDDEERRRRRRRRSRRRGVALKKGDMGMTEHAKRRLAVFGSALPAVANSEEAPRGHKY